MRAREVRVAGLGGPFEFAISLRLPEGRVTFHVLEAVNPAAALLDYAAANPVDHIVLGARCALRSSRVVEKHDFVRPRHPTLSLKAPR